jgi:Sec-independent protein secretion pathway component TatC
MSLIAHLTELRNRVAKSLLALVVAGGIAFWWYGHGLGLRADQQSRAPGRGSRRPVEQDQG